MNKQDLIDRLLVIHCEIENEEKALWLLEQERLAAERELQDAEDDILIGDAPPDGKNAEIRAAQLRAATRVQRLLLAEAESGVGRVKSRLRCLHNEFKALRAVIHPLGGDER